MSALDKITYPFRLAAWRADHLLHHSNSDSSSDMKENIKDFAKTALVVAIASGIGGYGLANVEPDSTPIDGQNEIIAEYTNRIMSIDSEQEANFNKLMKAWQNAEGDTKELLSENIKNTTSENYKQENSLLIDIYTEAGVSETELRKLSELYYNNVESDTPVTSSSDDDIGDGAFLHECQSSSKSMDTALNDIAECNIDKQAKEVEGKILSPLATSLTGGLLYMLGLIAYGETSTYEKLSRRTEKPRPRVKRNISPY